MLELPGEQRSCEADATQQSLPLEAGNGTATYSSPATTDDPQGTSSPSTTVLSELVTTKSMPLLDIHEQADISEGQRFSDADGLPKGAYIRQMHVDASGIDSSGSLADTSLIEGSSATIVEEKEAETLPAQFLGDKEIFEQEGTTVPVAEITHHVLELISIDATAGISAHGTAGGSDEKALDLNANTHEMSSQQAPQCTDKVDQVPPSVSQIHQVDAHYSDSTEFSSSPLLYDTSSPGNQKKSLQSSSPMPVPSSPFTADPTPPSSVPSSPRVHSAVDVSASLEALDRLSQSKDMQPSGDNHSSTRQPQAEDSPAIAASGTGLEQEGKMRTVCSVLPNPRHPTAISQRKQHEMLTRPFRPPALVTPKRSPTDNINKNGDQKDAIIIQNTAPPRRVLKSLPTAETGNRSKNKTSGAAIQFKSPLMSRNALEVDSSIRLTPTIQMLERKLQTLKRAIKVKEDNQEDQLRGLITKWTEAGREVAWELWEIVRNRTDGDQGDFMAIGGKRMYEESWGWEMGSDKRFKEGEEKEPYAEDVNNGTEESDTKERVDLMKGGDEDEDLDRPHNTLGTMLRQLGIDPQTLNWDDEEGAFKEVTDETQ